MNSLVHTIYPFDAVSFPSFVDSFKFQVLISRLGFSWVCQSILIVESDRQYWVLL